MLALLVGVHVKTLRAAARDGRLPVTYDTRTTFRHLRARATPAAARAFRRSYYRRMVRPDDRRTPLTWASVPRDYDTQIRALRRARGLSQAQLATLVGAARKAVVYQWEARKRCPSPVFWARIQAISTAGIQRAIQAAGATLWYLPPYSPDLNPIELCFAKLKALVRTARCRSSATLWPFLGTCLEHFSPDECRNYFRHCGYSVATRS